MSNRLKEAMENQHVSAAQLARAIGVSKSAISRIAKGERRPIVDLAQRIALALGRPVEVLFPPPLDVRPLHEEKQGAA